MRGSLSGPKKAGWAAVAPILFLFGIFPFFWQPLFLKKFQTSFLVRIVIKKKKLNCKQGNSTVSRKLPIVNKKVAPNKCVFSELFSCKMTSQLHKHSLLELVTRN